MTSNSRDTFSSLVEQIEQRLPPIRARSLCELKLSDRDYHCLSAWVREKLTPRTLKLGGWKVGAIVFNYITEIARREAVGGRLWPLVASNFPNELRSLLFPNDHPSSELKAWIREAANKLGLRHVLEENDSQTWYITTHLQFGFSAPGFREHLPEWFCGINQWEAIRRLLSGNLRSDSFCDLWQALRYYRRNWVSEDIVRTVIRDSPWVLPEWENDLVRLSQERIGLVDVELGEGDAELVPSQVEAS
jgi:hypothetical protein